jgi:UDP-N-acetylglucosamine 4-epimerase
MYDTAFHKNDLSSLSFLITGGCGFIGSNIAEYLLKYKAGKVVVLDNVSTGFKQNIEPFLSRKNFHFIDGDITNSEACHTACKGIDFVSHQAALGSVPRSVKDPAATHAVNATGFLNMLIAARDAGARRFVYASSSSVYGDHPVLPKKEEDTGNPLSPYAVTKKSNELYARVFAMTYGMEIIGLRYFNVFGPNQRPEGAYAAVIPLFMEAAMHKTSPYIDGDGEQTRDFTFVENAVQANIRSLFAANAGALNQVYNVAVGEKISVNRLYEIIASLGGSAVPAVHRETRAGDIRDSLADISKARQLLGYDPQITVNEGLKTAFDWYRKNFR